MLDRKLGIGKEDQ
jgi:hypothetical protein